MKSIGIISQTDNSGFVLCIAKLINTFGNKVVVVDATSTQKYRYTLTKIEGTVGHQEQYVNKFNEVDVAIGFNNLLELKKYFISQSEDFNTYDYVIINTDREEMCEEFDLKNANKLFFTTTFDKFELYRGVELLKFLCASKRREDTSAVLKINKVLSYADDVKWMDNAKINDITKELPIEWEGQDIIVGYDKGDMSAYINNQYANKIEVRYLCNETKNGINEVVTRILEEPKEKVEKALKAVEKLSFWKRN